MELATTTKGEKPMSNKPSPEQHRLRAVLSTLPYGACVTRGVPAAEVLTLNSAAAWLEEYRDKLKGHSERAAANERHLASVHADLRAVGRLLVRALPDLADTEPTP